MALRCSGADRQTDTWWSPATRQSCQRNSYGPDEGTREEAKALMSLMMTLSDGLMFDIILIDIVSS